MSVGLRSGSNKKENDLHDVYLSLNKSLSCSAGEGNHLFALFAGLIAIVEGWGINLNKILTANAENAA